MLRQFQGHFEQSDHDRMLRHSKLKGQSAAEYLRRALAAQLDRDDAVAPLPEEGGEVRIIPTPKQLGGPFPAGGALGGAAATGISPGLPAAADRKVP